MWLASLMHQLKAELNCTICLLMVGIGTVLGLLFKLSAFYLQLFAQYKKKKKRKADYKKK